MEDYNISSSDLIGGAVSQPVGHIQRILILDKTEKMINAWVAYMNATDNTTEKIRSRARCENNIRALLTTLKPRMKDKNKGTLTKIELLIKNQEYEECLYEIQEYLENDLKLTKIDTKRIYDSTNAETENENKSL